MKFIKTFEAFSNSFPKNVYVNLNQKDLKEYENEIFDLIQTAYTGKGGNFELNEDLPDGIIRVFRTKNMKDYIKDAPIDDIKERGKDLKVKNYIVNTVVLKDGTKGWVWSENEKFED